MSSNSIQNASSESLGQFTLSYTGRKTEQHLIDFYDVSQALVSFQRSIALTTHLVLNGTIITQSPALKNAKIYAFPSEPGSWKMTAVVVTSLYTLGTAQNNSPVGHILYSLYDYVVSQSLGVHVDYNKSLGQLYEEAKEKKVKIPTVGESQADSLIEKCSTAIREMHRPIYKNGTASEATVTMASEGEETPLHTSLTYSTYEFINETFRANVPELFSGRISSYNSNTYKGRVYVPKLRRPVSFELAKEVRNALVVHLVTASLHENATKNYTRPGCLIYFLAYPNTSKSGVLKSLTVTLVSDKPLENLGTP